MRRTTLWIFGIALVVRALIAIVQASYGINGNLNIDVYLYGNLNPGLELYHDFYAYYVKQLADLSNGLIPYKGFGYSYPPLFLFTLFPFYLISSQAASIPILLADAASASLVYLIVERYGNIRLAIIAGLVYSFLPLSLLYEGYLWFSSQPMAFFVLLSLLFLFEKKPIYSFAIFGVAVMFKQEALFILPAYLIWYLKDFRKELLKGLIVFVAVILLISLPFLIYSPSYYVTSVSYGLVGHAYSPALYPSSTSSLVSVTNVPSGNNSLICSTLTGYQSGSVCSYNNLTFTNRIVAPLWEEVFSAGFLNTISFWIAIPFFVLVLYNLFESRRFGNFGLMAAAYSSLLFLAIFSFSVHSIFRYYLVPVYLVLLATSMNRYSLFGTLVVSTFSLFLPSGPIQFVPPLFVMLIIMISQSRIQNPATLASSLKSDQSQIQRDSSKLNLQLTNKDPESRLQARPV